MSFHKSDSRTPLAPTEYTGTQWNFPLAAELHFYVCRDLGIIFLNNGHSGVECRAFGRPVMTGTHILPTYYCVSEFGVRGFESMEYFFFFGCCASANVEQKIVLRGIR
uniref:HDC09535 n=1 Tax=Drosophila melanogaster TaxID=7227 RepID=Q6ILD9_DROME|nr:TPA_inf: HDC09535 [Drosophila melanogaster]